MRFPDFDKLQNTISQIGRRARLRSRLRAVKSRAIKFRAVKFHAVQFRAMLFAPGVFFAAIGLAALIAPRFVAVLAAGFFLFLGVAFSFLAWKFIQLKRKVQHLARQFEGRIVVQGMPLRQDFTIIEESPIGELRRENKKITYH